jgi:hypothetical protein
MAGGRRDRHRRLDAAGDGNGAPCAQPVLRFQLLGHAVACFDSPVARGPRLHLRKLSVRFLFRLAYLLFTNSCAGLR